MKNDSKLKEYYENNYTYPKVRNIIEGLADSLNVLRHFFNHTHQDYCQAQSQLKLQLCWTTELALFLSSRPTLPPKKYRNLKFELGLHTKQLLEDNHIGRQPQWKMTSMEDELNERRPQWKTTSMKDNLN